MTDRQLGKSAHGELTNPHKRTKRRQSLDSFFLKNGVYDGKLFFSHDRVTYTFIFETEAIAVHLDASKRSLFVRGHRVSSLDCQPHVMMFLQRFRKAMAAEPKTAVFLNTFDAILAELQQTEI